MAPDEEKIQCASVASTALTGVDRGRATDHRRIIQQVGRAPGRLSRKHGLRFFLRDYFFPDVNGPGARARTRRPLLRTGRSAQVLESDMTRGYRAAADVPNRRKGWGADIGLPPLTSGRQSYRSHVAPARRSAWRLPGWAVAISISPYPRTACCPGVGADPSVSPKKQPAVSRHISVSLATAAGAATSVEEAIRAAKTNFLSMKILRCGQMPPVVV